MISVNFPRKSSMCVKSQDGSIYELLSYSEKHRSWFLNNSVCSNGKIFLTTKIDPLFIFIQYVENHCKERAQPLDQIMEESAEMFLEVLNPEQMKIVADQKGPENIKAFLYNEEKVLKWLKKKFEIVKASLRDQRITTSASSSNYVKSSVEETTDEDALAETALGVISEYISLDLIEKLDDFYGISKKSKEPIAQKRKAEMIGNEEGLKRIKIEEQENLSEESTVNAPKAPPKATTKSKALEKAAKGSKAISSFFTKK